MSRFFAENAVLNLCLKWKRDITELFQDTIVFLTRKLSLWGNRVRRLIFVNQTNINKLEFNLAQIWLKSFRKLFQKCTVIAIEANRPIIFRNYAEQLLSFSKLQYKLVLLHTEIHSLMHCLIDGHSPHQQVTGKWQGGRGVWVHKGRTLVTYIFKKVMASINYFRRIFTFTILS